MMKCDNMRSWDMKRIIIIGHRGLMDSFPENTLLSFIEAIKAGADGIELDVWLTRDGKLVISHDENLERVAGVNKSIKDMELREIKSIEIGEGLRIPTLEEVFETLPNDVLINVEIKDIDAVEKTLELIYRFNMGERIMISSFHIDVLTEVRKRDDNLKLGLLVEDENVIPKIPSLSKSLRLYSVNLPIDALKFFPIDTFKDFLEQMRKMNLKIVLWSSDDSIYFEDDNILKLKKLVDVVITNNIPMMRKYLFDSKNFNLLKS